MAERPDYPCPATGLPYCPDYCRNACLRLGVDEDPAVWPDDDVDPLCDQGTVWDR